MSTLYLKLAGTTCGDRMPKGGTPLSQGELDCVAVVDHRHASSCT